MSIHRIVLIVVVLFVVWRIAMAVGRRGGRMSAGADDFSRFSARRRDHRERMKRQGREGQEELVECAGCGTWVPVSRAAVAGDGSVYCGPECRDRATRGA